MVAAKLSLALLATLVVVATVRAQTLPLVSNALGSNMVLQSAPEHSRLWGWASGPLQAVTVTVGNNVQVKKTSSSEFAPYFWAVDLDPMVASNTAYTITISSGSSNVVLQNVLFGQVFVCSGQSNMQMGVAAAFNATQEIALAAKYPQIRLFTVGQTTISATPLTTFATIEQQWSVASSASVGNGPWSFFSATCWFFGRKMADELKVPIGLVSTNWGGTYVQAWSSPEALSKCKTSTQESHTSARSISDGPNPNQPSVLWNAMVVPLLNMRIAAVTWYQAEANVSPKGDLDYICMFPAMIQDWAAKMNSKNFRFYFVQLAPYWTDDHTSLAGMRLSQEAALLIPYVGMATAVDLGDPTSNVGVIHPRDKQTVGLRLARAALNLSYGKPVSWLGPSAVKAVADPSNGVIVVTFKVQTQYGDSLQVRSIPTCPGNAGYCRGFEYLSGNNTWVSVSGAATVLDPTSTIAIPYNPSDVPKSVRYLFADWPLCSVYTNSNLPALPFMINISKQ